MHTLLIESVTDHAIFALDSDGVIVTWNRGAARLKGYRSEEDIGRHISSVYVAEERRAGLPEEGLRAALEPGRWESEGWRQRKDGMRFRANATITALHSDDGRHQGFAKVPGT